MNKLSVVFVFSLCYNIFTRRLRHAGLHIFHGEAEISENSMRKDFEGKRPE